MINNNMMNNNMMNNNMMKNNMINNNMMNNNMVNNNMMNNNMMNNNMMNNNMMNNMMNNNMMNNNMMNNKINVNPNQQYNSTVKFKYINQSKGQNVSLFVQSNSTMTVQQLINNFKIKLSDDSVIIKQYLLNDTVQLYKNSNVTV